MGTEYAVFNPLASLSGSPAFLYAFYGGRG